jgi:hypothetical protein
VSTFENGWICKSCWTANREQDMRCYRCHLPSPYHQVVAELPHERRHRAPRSSVLKPAVARTGTAITRAWLAASRTVWAGPRHAFQAIRHGGSLLAAGASGGTRAVASAALVALRMTLAGIGWLFVIAASIGRTALRLASAIASAVRSMLSSARRGLVGTLHLLRATRRRLWALASRSIARLGWAITRFRGWLQRRLPKSPLDAHRRARAGRLGKRPL